MTVNAEIYPSIQAAHDALPSSGGELMVPCGSYGELKITKSNIVVHGSGECSLLRSAAKQDNAVTIAAGLTNVTIEGLNVQAAWTGTKDQWDEAHIYIGDAIFAAGTDAFPITNLTIQNNTISNGNNGVLLHRVNGGAITNNSFSNATVASLAQAAILTSTNIMVSNNTFSDYANSANAVYLRGDGDAFGGTGEDTGSSYVTVTNNVAKGAYSYEIINVLDCHHLTISNNALTIANGSANSTGIQLQETSIASQRDTVSQTHHNTLSSNVIEVSIEFPGSGNNGITLSDQSPGGKGFGANDNEVFGNTIRMSGRGINVGANCKRNVISANQITIVTSKIGFDGIGVSDITATDTKVSGNTVMKATGNGISNLGTRTEIRNNIVSSGTYPGGAGLYMPSSAGSSALIANNTFVNNAGRGISIATSVSDVELRDNTGTSNGLSDAYSGARLRSNSPSLTIKAGEKGTAQLVASSIGLIAGSATLACSSLPAGVQCSFSPSSVSLKKSTNVSLTIVTNHLAAAGARPRFTGWVFAILVPGVLAGGGARKRAVAVLVLVIVALALALSGCGNSGVAPANTMATASTDPNTPLGATVAGNYKVVVTIAAATGVRSSTVLDLTIVP